LHGEGTNTTIYRLPIARLKRETDHLDWIDDHESLTVDAGFCAWLAERFDSPSPVTNEIVATDRDANVSLYRWNIAFARSITGGDPDVFDGLIGGDSANGLVACFDTWMTQRQAWQMWSFFRSSIREGSIVVELRVKR